MPDALRLLLLIFTRPLAGLREVRDRAPLLPALALAFAANLAYFLVTQWTYWLKSAGVYGRLRYALAFCVPVLMLAFVLAPLLIFLANLLGARGRFRESLREDYTPLITALFYVWALACLWALPVAIFEQATVWRESVIAESLKMMAEKRFATPPGLQPGLLPRLLTVYLALMTVFPLFAVWLWLATVEVFRLSWLRSAAVVFGSFLLGAPLAGLTWPLFVVAATSPFLAILSFVLLRGYFLTLARRAQAQDNFQKHLEAATLNPADASAHYNLGLIHLRRNQLEEAMARFQKAIETDEDETDAHFQLGRIARSQSRWADAVRHFEEVVRRDETHAQHEIWREVGATYLSVEQYDDARAMLERFLERRENDPEALYLLGRAHAGLGAKDAARTALNACIEAVKTAPNYKYHSDKRWLNEAQQFLRSLA